MNAPRLEIHLDRIEENARVLAERLRARGITICGVTKATLGSPEVARAFLAAGATSLGESRIENVETLRRGGVSADILLVRSPMISQTDRIVAQTDVSLNTEVDVIDRISASAFRQNKRHGIILMVELGDLREGIMPADLHETVRQVLDFPGIILRGIGTNLACQNGVIPDATNMAELSRLATSVERTFNIDLEIISGGNSANLAWALEPANDIGRINHLRLGESVLLGRETINRSVLPGLHADAISIVGEVIESKLKPSQPTGDRGQAAFGAPGGRPTDRGSRRRVIVALGRADADTEGLIPPQGYEILGASSDHLVLDCDADAPAVGSELRFGLNYSALMRTMASPFVTRHYAPVDVHPESPSYP